MGSKLGPEELALYRLVDETLRSRWDPIGVGGMAAARDEYRGYIQPVFALLKAGAGREELAALLSEFEAKNMGLVADRQRALSTADDLLEARAATLKVALRVLQLDELRLAIEALLPLLDGVAELAGHRPEYQQALAESLSLRPGSLAQGQLDELSRSVPRLFWLHKEWVPPQAPWFARLDEAHERVVRAAERLRVTGER